MRYFYLVWLLWVQKYCVVHTNKMKEGSVLTNGARTGAHAFFQIPATWLSHVFSSLHHQIVEFSSLYLKHFDNFVEHFICVT